MRTRYGILISVVSSIVTTLAVLALLSGAGAAVAQQGGPASEPAPAAPPAAVPPAGPAADDSLLSSYEYYRVAGAMLRPRDGATQMAYDALGCVHATSGAYPILGTELHLPERATIKYLRVYFNDTSPSGYIDGFLTLYDGGIHVTDTISLRNNWDLGWGYHVSELITHTVDNGSYDYTLYAVPSALTSTLQICGLRVAYVPPPPLVQLHLLPVDMYNAQP